MTRSMMGLWCLAVGLCLVAPSAMGQEPTSESVERLATAESVIAREEAASERPFDPSFRAKTLERLAALPMAALLRAQARDDVGLGLNALGDSQADLVYTPVTPCRIIDTRLAGGALSAGVPRSFRATGDATVQGGANCGIPFGPATSAMINFVAVNPAGPGNVRLVPFGQPMPKAAIITYSNTAGTALSNGLAVALCNPSGATCTNDVTIRADVSAVDLVADVEGYFQRVSTGGVGTSLLADSAVTTVKMANGSVTTLKIADGSITAPKIANGAAVRSLNGQTDAVTLAAGNGLGVSQGSGTVTVASNATPTNTANTIVSRDGGGSFAAGSISLAGYLNLPWDTSASAGILMKGGVPFLHNFGTSNTFAGINAGNLTLAGDQNAAFGSSSLRNNTTGNSNAAFGFGTLYANTSGVYSSVLGARALEDNTTGSSNTAVGFAALVANTIGSYNSVLGANTLTQASSGTFNVAVGYGAGSSLTSGNYNIYIGNSGVSSESNTIRIGSASQAATYVAGIYGRTSAAGVAVYVDSSGQLGTATSSRRYKKQIADMAGESDVLLKLRPVSFYYRPELDETHTRQYGLVAEEVAEIAPELVLNDENGAPQTVRYHFVNAMLLNEVQKQRRLVEEQKATIEGQESRIHDLEARFARLEAALAGDR